MNNLIFEIGNSNIVVGIYQDLKKQSYRYETDVTKSSQAYYELLSNILTIEFDNIIISSVVPALTTIIYDLCVNYLQLTPQIVDHNYHTDVVVKTDNPKEVGSDLVCAVAGANNYYPSGIIIDLGTASKVISYKNKTFLGVLIAPGIKISANSLINNASLLKDFSLKPPTKLFGTNTNESLQSGLILGHAAMLNGLVVMAKEVVNTTNIIITGGLSPLVLPFLDFDYDYIPDLILDSLNEMIINNLEE